MKLNPNKAVAFWISIVLGKEKHVEWYYRVALTILLPILPISWIIWWAVYAIIGRPA